MNGIGIADFAAERDRTEVLTGGVGLSRADVKQFTVDKLHMRIPHHKLRFFNNQAPIYTYPSQLFRSGQ